MYASGYHDYHSYRLDSALQQFACDWRLALEKQRRQEDTGLGPRQLVRWSFYDYHENEPLGKWLITLHRYWNAIVEVSSGKSGLGAREYSQFLPKIGGAYLLALENLLTQAADQTSTVTTTEVWWELYRWQNEVQVSADLNHVPYLLRPELWPEMGIRVTLAISDGSKPNFDTSGQFPDYNRSEPIAHQVPARTEDEEFAYEKMSTLWDAACVVEGENGINSIISGEFQKLQIDTECDSDTDVEARVSPEAGASSHTSLSPPANYPLRSGDFVEDEEMFSRVMQTPCSERAAFTSMMCDNE